MTDDLAGGDDLDTGVEQAADALRGYVAVARGVRAEFDPEQADLDPRVEQAAIALGLALGRLEDRFEVEIGFVPTIQPMWQGQPDDQQDGAQADGDEPAGDQPDGAELLTADAFSLGLVVGVEGPTSPDQLDGVLGVVDDAAGALVDRLESEGYVVTEYFVARGEHAGLDGDDDELGDDAELGEP